MRVNVDPRHAMKEFTEFSDRMQRGRDLLDKTRDKDVQIATTPKREVFRQDKVVLYHYTATARKTVSTSGNSSGRIAIARVRPARMPSSQASRSKA